MIACDPKEAVAVANKLVNDNTTFVAGHFCSGSSIPASAVYNEEQILTDIPGLDESETNRAGFRKRVPDLQAG